MSITKREILCSVSIVAVLLLIGVLISGAISDAQMDKNEVYNKAAKIESSELFQYGMRTNVGYAFVYGDLIAVDTVTYPEIGGEYMYVEKIKEKYTKHTRTVTTTVNGKTHTRTETYWTWDRVGSEDRCCREVNFLGVTFDSGKFHIPSTNYITTIKQSSRVRYKYYGTDIKHTGTIFTSLRDGSISDRNELHENMTITQAIELLEINFWTPLFWVFWVLVIGGCVYGFFLLENRWLD